MEHFELNLTRKWRSKNFQEVVGQSLAVKILQNSLYLNQFFPVYLFAGQRGCGKTSTARIFAAAVNCQKLAAFQADPRKVILPCLQCDSCVAMSAGQHPDFIEIDAASHTGVDNVRNIIDASSFLPLLSHKKIYLIDEAHMLSKAAFNAFLKILEEPPMSVIFILATTDMHKILETVKSRCFQIFFDPVPVQIIQDHLEKLCKAEQILYEPSGLAVIARESDGSVRDAINLLEQVRFATKKVSQESVLTVLGHIDQDTLVELFMTIMTGNVQEVLQVLVQLEKYELAVEYIWSQLAELVYDAVLIQYEVGPRYFTYLDDDYKNIMRHMDMEKLLDLFRILCLEEHNIAKTTKKLRFLEMILLQYCMSYSLGSQELKKKINEVYEIVQEESESVEYLWLQFIAKTKKLDDLVVVTMFQDAQMQTVDQTSGKITISFLKKFSMFCDMLEAQKKHWLPVLQHIFGSKYYLAYTFDAVAQQAQKIPTYQDRSMKSLSSEQVQNRIVHHKFDISDPEKWKLTHELLKHFDGVITEVSGDKV
jgi:DNA polymerase-3 subunit gamma/tau